MKSRLSFILIFFTATSSLAKNSNNELITKARDFFKKYETLEKAFDKKFIELFSDDAIIIINSDNILDEKRKLEITGKDYKELILSTLDYAKKSRNFSKYSKLKFVLLDKNRVKITADRFSVFKKYHSPIVIIIGLDSKKNFIVLYQEIYSK